jgi:acarbose 7IV-phosphotransferase
VVTGLAPRARSLVEVTAASGVPTWTGLHDHDGSSAFHRPFLEAAASS